VVGNFTVLRYANQSARLYGADLSAGRLIAESTRLGRFETQLTASYTHGTNEDTDDALYDVMPLNARLALTQDLGAWHNAVEGEFVAARDDISQVRNEVPTAGYGLVHLRSSYERDAWSVQVGIDNLLDRYYELPLGGAYVGQGTTMTVPPPPNQPQWGRPVPGAGRSVYAGVNLRF
jgi:iron complex outermembrane recepter protein